MLRTIGNISIRKVFSVNKRSLLQSALALALVSGFSASAMAQDKPLKIGVTGGPHAQIFEVVKKVAEKDGLKIQVIEFSDYVQPNAALASGDLDANSYQHKPYLDQQVKDRGYKFVSAGYTVNFPIGIYSKKIKNLNDLKQGAKFGIPNDPTNGGRVLLVLQEKGLIKLRPEAGLGLHNRQPIHQFAASLVVKREITESRAYAARLNPPTRCSWHLRAAPARASAGRVRCAGAARQRRPCRRG